MELEHLASRPFAGILLEISNLTKNQATSPLTSTLNNDELSAQTLPSTNHKQSKLKAFGQRSHLNVKNFSNFLHSNTSSTNNVAAGGDLTKLQQQQQQASNFENPTPIALEPCFNNKAAVLSLIVRLPTGGTGAIPIGQTGIAIASALVSLGAVEQKMHDNIKSNSNKKTNNPAFV